MTLVEGGVMLNAFVDPSAPVASVMEELEAMAEELESSLAAEPDERLRFDGLLRIFYRQWHFRGDAEQFFSSENAFINKVLEQRKGIPITLGAILMYFADRLSLPISPVAFPTQLVLRADWSDGEVAFYNPFDGERVSTRTLEGWIIGQSGPLARLEQSNLLPTDNATLVGRWLSVIKSALLREEEYNLALRCSEMALTFDPDNPYEIRDRGYIYQQLDCDWVAASDYEYFIEQCPDDPASELLKLQVRALTEAQPILH